jgi:hypothetical protein
MEKLDQFLSKVVDQIINPIILLLAGAAFVVFIWGVFQFVRNAADETERNKGKSAIMWGIIGLVIIFGVYGLINIALLGFGLDPIEKSLGPIK